MSFSQQSLYETEKSAIAGGKKGEVFLTCSLAAKSYTMITQDYITNFVN